MHASKQPFPQPTMIDGFSFAIRGCLLLWFANTEIDGCWTRTKNQITIEDRMSNKLLLVRPAKWADTLKFGFGEDAETLVIDLDFAAKSGKTVDESVQEGRFSALPTIASVYKFVDHTAAKINGKKVIRTR